MTVLTHYPIGVAVHGEHHSADASAGIALTLNSPESSTPHAAVTIAESTERIALTFAQATVGVLIATVELFFDNVTLTAAEAMDDVTDAGGSPDTFTMIGDHTDVFRVGRLFTVANSSNNDGTYTVTAVAFDGTLTTVSIATGSWTDGADDGDATALATATPGMSILAFESALNLEGGAETTWPPDAPRFGPYGFTVYGQTVAAADLTDFIIDGFVQTLVTKTGPIQPQARA